MTDFKTIPLQQIYPDNNQPRKFYDEIAMQELTDSIKEKGVLQPVLIRPNGKGYILVCGERRYRGAMAAGLSEIPAVIRELTDEEALELQIIENLQRKDVHPIEEAVAFKSLVDHKQYSVIEVAARIGKRDSYVKQRMRLNDLTKEWQQLFYRSGISLTDAFKICALPANHQQEIFKEEINKDDGKGTYSIRGFILDRYKGDLHNAVFDLADSTLDKKAGSCLSCQFNSNVSQLFPELGSLPRCTNVSCFKHKSDVHFDRELRKAKEDPLTLLIYDGYSKSKLVEQLQKEGVAVLREGYGEDCKELHCPTPPYWENFKEEQAIEDDEMSEAEVRKLFEREQKDYEKEKEEFDQKVSTGKYKKAFVVYDQYGADQGRYKYVQLTPKATSKASKEKIKSGAADIEDINEEISRIRDREKRAKELDAEKLHATVKEILAKSKVFTASNRNCELINEEITAAALALFEAGSFEFRGWFSKHFKVDKYSLKPAHLEKLSLTSYGLNEILWYFILDKLMSSGSHLTSANGLAIHNIALHYHQDEVKAATIEQEEKIARRQERVDKRIAELNAKKKELQASAKSEEKKSTPKSSSKKSK